MEEIHQEEIEEEEDQKEDQEEQQLLPAVVTDEEKGDRGEIKTIDVRDIVEVNDGSIWAATNHGIFQFEGNEWISITDKNWQFPYPGRLNQYLILKYLLN